MSKNSKHKLIILISILVTTLFIMGCSGGNYTTTLCIQNDTKNSMYMSYSSFHGYKFTTLKLRKGTKLTLNINVTTKKGNLKVTLTDENSKQLFKVENPEKALTKVIKIDRDGIYKIKVDGNHKGSYKISWSVK